MGKVIFIDVDETLRNDKREITPRTVLALKEVQNLGYETILCTGRPRDYAEKLNTRIEGSRYIIFDNGGGIYDSKEKRILYENAVKTESILSLYKISNSENVRFILGCNGTNYTNKIKHQDGTEKLIEEPLEEFLNKKIVVQVTIASEDFHVIKNMKSKIGEILGVKIVNQHKALIDAKYKPVGTIYYNVVDENTSKGNAIKYFRELLNIGIENCIAIGDGNNDISMFNECGYRVAMKNAMPGLKKIADYITDDNNHDGIAKYLEMLK